MGARKCEFFSDEIALGQSPVSIEVRIVAQLILVAGSREAVVGNSRLTHGVRTGEDGEGRGKRRVERRRRRRLSWRWTFVVALNPRKLASGVQNHLLALRWGPYWQRNNQSHGVLEG